MFILDVFLSFFLSSQSGAAYVNDARELQGFTFERAHKRRLDQHSVNGSSVCVCVCPRASLMAREVFDPLRGGEARGLQSVKQIRLSLLRLVAYYSPA